jgi:hypothetical protein
MNGKGQDLVESWRKVSKWIWQNSMHDEQKKHGHLDSHNSSTSLSFLKEDSSNKK